MDIDSYDKVISLGYICNVTSMLTTLKKRPKSHVFDRIASPMWAVSELVSNDFSDFLSKSNIEKKVLFTNSQEEFVIDKKHYIRLVAPDITSAAFERIRVSLVNKADEFKSMLQNADPKTPILFIRCEEKDSYADRGDRVIFPEYAERYAQSELSHVEQLSDTLKTKYPNLSFKIIFLNSNAERFTDEERNIIGIPNPCCDYRDHCVGSEMAKAIKDALA